MSVKGVLATALISVVAVVVVMRFAAPVRNFARVNGQG